MTRKEIEKLSAVGPYCFETDREERWYEIGCIDGLRAADAELNLKSLWHDVSEEEPKKEEFILVEVIDTLTPNSEIGYYVEYVSEWLLDSMKTEGFKCRWAYISDLLPKGDKK